MKGEASFQTEDERQRGHVSGAEGAELARMDCREKGEFKAETIRNQEFRVRS